MGLYTKAQLTKKVKAELQELIDQHSIELDEDATAGDMREALLELEEPDEVEEEEDDELPEEDDVEEDEVEAPTKAVAKKTKYSNEAGTLGAKEVATAIGTDAKTLRQFFRSGKSSFTAVGAGGRYEFAAADVDKIKTEFDAWKSGKPGRGRAAGEGSTRTRGKAAKVAEVIEEVEEIEELEDLEEFDEEDLDIEE